MSALHVLLLVACGAWFFERYWVLRAIAGWPFVLGTLQFLCAYFVGVFAPDVRWVVLRLSPAMALHAGTVGFLGFPGWKESIGVYTLWLVAVVVATITSLVGVWLTSRGARAGRELRAFWRAGQSPGLGIET